MSLGETPPSSKIDLHAPTADDQLGHPDSHEPDSLLLEAQSRSYRALSELIGKTCCDLDGFIHAFVKNRDLTTCSVVAGRLKSDSDEFANRISALDGLSARMEGLVEKGAASEELKKRAQDQQMIKAFIASDLGFRLAPGFRPRDVAEDPDNPWRGVVQETLDNLKAADKALQRSLWAFRELAGGD